ncbi:MAG: Na+/H+ antiporter subunit E [Acidimicrobiia bacterium]|nr:Na+/H+ antiporter subunit E [Acidimicrobiia bacterium]
MRQIARLIERLRESFAADTSASLAGLVVFLVRYAGMVVVSNLRVAWEVITPSNDQIREAIVAVPLQVGSLNAALLVANAVSFTPGSLAVELTEEPTTLYIHVLHFSSVDEVQETVRSLERLAARVYPARTGAALRSE